MHPTELANLLRDTGQVGKAMIKLRALLPLCNVSCLASLATHLLQPDTLAALPEVRLNELHCACLVFFISVDIATCIRRLLST